MFEFGDVFANELTTTIYFYGSMVCLLACTSAALWLQRQPQPVALHWKFGRA
jgi:hypothetical protein